ncbi:MAG: HAD family hydrolase [Nocardioides sp.]
MNAAQLVARAAVVLLDFDGPITPLMPPPANAEAAETARTALQAAVGHVPADIETTTDHLAILRYTGERHPEALPAVERACIDAEVTAARTATPTDGAYELLTACASRGQPVAIVSNNDRTCIDAFLDRHQWVNLVATVIGRTPGRPDLMKPHPASITAALTALDARAETAVLIGDSPSDIYAASEANVQRIGYAKTIERRPTLRRAGAISVVDAIGELTESTACS